MKILVIMVFGLISSSFVFPETVEIPQQVVDWQQTIESKLGNHEISIGMTAFRLAQPISGLLVMYGTSLSQKGYVHCKTFGLCDRISRWLSTESGL